MVITVQDTKIKPGYKQTEVGVIPEDWELRTFGEVMTGFTSGATPSRSRPDFFKGNIRWITSGELNYNVIVDTIEKISVEAVSKTNLKLLPKGTFLIAITGMEAEGTRGSCGIVGAEATTNQHCMALFPTKELSTHYLFHYYVYKGKSLALQYCQGTKQQDYTGKIVKLLPILLPPLSEQRAIATTLSDVDALITSLDKLIAKKRDIKQATMQQLLTGKMRLPGFSGEWEMKKLEDVFNVTAGGDFDPHESSLIQNEVYRYPIYSNALSNDGLYGFCSYNSHQAGSITVTARGTLGVANFRNHNFTAIGRVLVLQPNMAVDGRFFSEFINNQIDFVIESTGVPQLTAPQISKYQLSVPSLCEQQAIATVLSDMDAEIAALEQKRDKTRALKQGMMQELLTGKTRLVTP